MVDAPESGDVWSYPYLWSWQSDRGETEGRKGRPVGMVQVVKTEKGTLLFILPITGMAPGEDREALELPKTEIRRVGLDTAKRLWLVLDDCNVDVLERSFYFESDGRIGRFSAAFRRRVIETFRAVVDAKHASITPPMMTAQPLKNVRCRRHSHRQWPSTFNRSGGRSGDRHRRHRNSSDTPR